MESPLPILITDDVELWHLVKRALLSNHIRRPLRRVQDGVAAIGFLERQRRLLNRRRCPVSTLLVLDFRKPRLSSFEVLEWVRAQPEGCFTTLVIHAANLPIDPERPLVSDGSPFFLNLQPLKQFDVLTTKLNDCWVHSARLSSAAPQIKRFSR